MYDTPQLSTPLRHDLRRRRPLQKGLVPQLHCPTGSRPELERKRHTDFALNQRVEAKAHGRLERAAEQDVAEVAVNRSETCIRHSATTFSPARVGTAQHPTPRVA